ncbi:TIGR04222 domain-containing membrane protein [Streptomyces sp. NRRL S-1521]|uniref:TIGR04222 domain-containing membrane protein n=1 Tax=Streptomyces sp. NRRL S-1521 TaxID=1609100 RepID=UPI00099F3299|nr:TIGR04222 domain-containing membrane protein [Streptomyces sp. NRRL S-1521]
MSVAVVAYATAVLLSCVPLVMGVVTVRRGGSRHGEGSRAGDGAFVRGTLEAAFLSGGPARAADAVIAGLHEDGRLVVAGPGVVGITRPVARNAAEQAVIDAHTAAPSGALHWLRAAVMRSRPVQETGDALAERGLVVRPGPRRTWRRWAGAQVFLTFIGLPTAGVLTALQYADDDYTEPHRLLDSVLHVLLPAAALGIGVGIVSLTLTSGQLTPAGRRALQQYVDSSRHLTGAAHLVGTRGLPAAHPDLRSQLIAAARARGLAAPPSSPAPLPFQDPGLWSAGAAAWCGSATGFGGAGGGSACSGGGGGAACSGSGSACSAGSSCSGGGSSCSGGGGSSCSGGGGGGSSCGGGGGGGSC